MSPGPRGWENPGVEQTVETPPPSPAAPDPAVSPLSSSTGRAGDHRPVRLLLVDDHQVVLEGLVSMLASERDRVTILGATTEPAEALRLAADLDPDVVLLDVRLKGASGLDVCQELTRRHERLKVVFFTVYDDEQYLFQALRVGASGFLLKRTTAGELAGHLERVMGGEVTIDPAIAVALREGIFH